MTDASSSPISKVTSTYDWKFKSQQDGLSMLLIMGLAFTGLMTWQSVGAASSRDIAGHAGELFAFVALVNFLTSFGIPLLIIRFSGNRSFFSVKLFKFAILITAGSTLLVALLFELVFINSKFLGLGELSLFGFSVIVFFACMYSISTVVDARLLALGRTDLYCLRILLIIILRFAASKSVSGDSNSIFVFVVMIGAFGLTCLPFIPKLLRTSPVDDDRRESFARKELVSFASANYFSYLAMNSVLFLVPVVCARSFRHQDYLILFLVWSIVSAGFAILQQVGVLLLARSLRVSSVEQKYGTGLVRIVGSISVLVVLGWFAFRFASVDLYSMIFKKDANLVRKVAPNMWLGLLTLGPYVCMQIEARRLLRHGLLIKNSIFYAAATLTCVIYGGRNGDIEEFSNWWLIGNILCLPFVILGLVRTTRSIGLTPSLRPSEK